MCRSPFSPSPFPASLQRSAWRRPRSEPVATAPRRPARAQGREGARRRGLELGCAPPFTSPESSLQSAVTVARGHSAVRVDDVGHTTPPRSPHSGRAGLPRL
ncbi:hypothetical protein ISCGN_005303 [Ixodes scapularis]